MSPVLLQTWQGDRPVPVTMWQGGGPVAGAYVARQDAALCGSSTLSSAPADSEVLNRTQGTLGYVGVPAVQGSDCRIVVGYAHSTTLWSTPVQSVVLVRAA